MKLKLYAYAAAAAALLALASCAGGPADGPARTEAGTGSVTGGAAPETSAVFEITDQSGTCITDPCTSAAEDVDTDISRLAVGYYMLPVEDYSFERSEDVEFVMIHFSSNVKAKPDDPFDVDDIKNIYLSSEVSTNYVIDRDGTVYCFIPESRCAWHAGVGRWKDDGRLTNRMNLYSIGIELLAVGTEKEMSGYITPERYRELPESFIGYTDAQYESLGLLLDDICGRYGIARDREHIIGHQEYAAKKPDPGELFDWDRVTGAGQPGT